LAGKANGAFKVAYWDTAQGNPPQSLIGQIRGTPTIKFIVPSKKNKRTSNKKKSVKDYNGERKVGAMFAYAKNMMPSYLTKIDSAAQLGKFEAKAEKYFLPKVLLFTKARSTQIITKALSTEFRRRALIGKVKLSKANIDLVKKYKVNTKMNNVLMVLKEGGEMPVVMDSKFTLAKAKKFLKIHALQKLYFEDEDTLAKIAARDGATKAEL